jgi:hypothetical protein
MGQEQDLDLDVLNTAYPNGAGTVGDLGELAKESPSRIRL